MLTETVVHILNPASIAPPRGHFDSALSCLSARAMLASRPGTARMGTCSATEQPNPKDQEQGWTSWVWRKLSPEAGETVDGGHDAFGLRFGAQSQGG